MKKLLFITLIFTGLCSASFAQQNNRDTSQATMNDYERMLEAQLQVNFRNHAIQTLELTEDQIIAFDPIYRSYMNEKEEVFKRKQNILNNLSEEMKEDDSQSEKKQEWAGAVENYWETEIALMKLRKDYFDRLEDQISPTKAFQFFLMEDAVQTRIHEVRLAEVMPMIIEMERMPARDYGSDIQGDTTGMNINSNWNNDRNRDSMNNQMPRNDNMTNMNSNRMMGKSNVEDYDKWFMGINKSGNTTETNLSHQDIQEGLSKLVGAIESIAHASNANIPDMTTKKERILTLANQMTQDPTSTQHANMAQEAFTMTADLISTVSTSKNYDNAKTTVDEAQKAAQNVKTNIPLDQQTTAVNNFFSHAQKAVSNMSKEVKW